jgi:hypothetical protein
MGVFMENERAFAQSNPAQNAVLELDHGWQFRQVTASAQEA